MSTAQDVVAASIGLAAGLVLALSLGPRGTSVPSPREGASHVEGEVEPESAAPPSAQSRAPSAPLDCVTRQAVLASSVEGAELRLAGLEAYLELLRGRRIAREGRPMPWPDDPPEGQAPPVFEEGVGEAASTLEMVVDQVDCSEYPCIAVLRTPEPMEDVDDEPISWSELKAAMAGPFPELQVASSVIGADPRTREGLVTVSLRAPSDEGEAFATRMGHRVQGVHRLASGAE